MVCFGPTSARYLLPLLALLATACGGYSTYEQRHAEPSSLSDPFQQALLALPVTAPQGSLSQATVCLRDRDDASAVLSTALDLKADNAEEFILSCQSLFACSPSAQRAVSDYNQTNASFMLSFVRFEDLPGAPPFSSPIRGLYLQSTRRIFIQSQIVSGGSLVDSCSAFLHELVHLTHDMQGQSIATFPEEYSAHYAERVFIYEFSPSTRRYTYTREDLARVIAEDYRFSPSQTELRRVASSYAPFPWEKVSRVHPSEASEQNTAYCPGPVMIEISENP